LVLLRRVFLCVCSLASSHAPGTSRGAARRRSRPWPRRTSACPTGTVPPKDRPSAAAEAEVIWSPRALVGTLTTSVAEGVSEGPAGAVRPPRTSRWMTPRARTARRQRRARVSGGDHHHHQRRRRERGIDVCAEGCRLRFDRGLDLPPSGIRARRSPSRTRLSEGPRPGTSPLSCVRACVCVRASVCSANGKMHIPSPPSSPLYHL